MTRKSALRIVRRDDAVELAHETRVLTEAVIRSQNDDHVDMPEHERTVARWADHVGGLPEKQRLAATAFVADAALTNIFGARARVSGWGFRR